MSAQIGTERAWNQQSWQPKLAMSGPEISKISNHDSQNWHRLKSAKSAIMTAKIGTAWYQLSPMEILHLQNCLFSLFSGALCTEVYCEKGWKRKILGKLRWMYIIWDVYYMKHVYFLRYITPEIYLFLLKRKIWGELRWMYIIWNVCHIWKKKICFFWKGKYWENCGEYTLSAMYETYIFPKIYNIYLFLLKRKISGELRWIYILWLWLFPLSLLLLPTLRQKGEYLEREKLETYHLAIFLFKS